MVVKSEKRVFNVLSVQLYLCLKHLKLKLGEILILTFGLRPQMVILCCCKQVCDSVVIIFFYDHKPWPPGVNAVSKIFLDFGLGLALAKRQTTENVESSRQRKVREHSFCQEKCN